MQTRHLPNRDIFVVSHPDQLFQILKEGVAKTVVLQFPFLASNKISYWENKLNAEKNACGCGEGAAFLLIMLAGLTILIFSGSPLLPKSVVATALFCTVLAFASIAIGKTFGRFRARRRLKRLIDDLNITLISRHLYPQQVNWLPEDK